MAPISLPRLRRKTANYRNAVALARALVTERLQYFNQGYGYKIGKVSIRKQKRRWGSCSRQGNLNFNYRIIHLPDAELDYVIAHELCHLGEFNHSKAFWDLLARTIPDWKTRRAALRRYRF